MDFRLLGPVEVVHQGRAAALGGPRQRAVLAMLALAAPEVVSTDRLVDGLWGEEPPARPLPTLQVFVHNLRKALRALDGDAAHIVSRPPGYCLVVGAEQTDVSAFLSGVEESRELRRAGRHEEAATVLERSLGLWRGPALADLRDAPFASPEAVRLDEQRLLAREESFDLALEMGRHAQLVSSLEQAVSDYPMRERLWGQLMVALYRCDRQADALAAYGRARDRLADELGIDPSEALQQLELGILRQDPALAAPAAVTVEALTSGTGPVAPRRGGRVPVVATPTYGRDDLVAHVVAQAARPDVRVVTLTGPGGSGKSRVGALAAGASTHHHPGGVWYLTATEETDAVQLAAEVVHLLTGADAPVEDPLQTLDPSREHPPTLLVLDNLEVLRDAADLIGSLVERTPHVTVLVTSRLPLRLRAEHEVPVPPLDTAPEGAVADELRQSAAVALFLDRAAAAGAKPLPTEALPDVAELCRFLDGLPLALELAAARSALMEPRAILERVREGLEILSTTAPDVPVRQRTLDATIRWSYDRLDVDARLVCDRLALFERGFTLEALDAVCDDVPSVLDALTRILDARLIRTVESRVEVRLMMLGTVRAFARRRLQEHVDLPGRRERLAVYLRDRLERWAGDLDGPDGAVALGRFDDAAADVAAAHDWAVESGDASLAASLALHAQDFWVASGRLHDALDRLTRTRSMAGLDMVERARLTTAIGKTTYLSADFRRAREECADALRVSGADGPAPEPVTAVTARTYLGGALVVSGEPREGARHAAVALTSARELGLYPLEAVALSMLAIAAAVAGDFDTERMRYEERLHVVRARGDQARLADTLNTLAEIALDELDAVTARAYAEESLRIAGSALPLEARDALISLARVCCVNGDLGPAAEHLRAALRLSDRTGQTLALAQCLRVGGCLAGLAADHASAIRFFAAAQSLCPSPSGADDPAERDLAQGLTRSRAQLGVDAQRREGMIGATLPLASVRVSLNQMLDRVRSLEMAS